MTILNITHQGLSRDYPLDFLSVPSDLDIRRIAVEIAGVPAHAFDDHVVDRLESPRGEDRIYLRPKVPFG